MRHSHLNFRRRRRRRKRRRRRGGAKRTKGKRGSKRRNGRGKKRHGTGLDKHCWVRVNPFLLRMWILLLQTLKQKLTKLTLLEEHSSLSHPCLTLSCFNIGQIPPLYFSFSSPCFSSFLPCLLHILCECDLRCDSPHFSPPPYSCIFSSLPRVYLRKIS